MEPNLSTLSIIIPTYGGGSRLPRLIGALGPQLADTDEIIIVDDCSPDNTADIAKGLDVRLVLLPENVGVGTARNAGAKAANNEILVFLDDDVLPPDRYLGTIRTVFADPATFCAQGPQHLSPLSEKTSIWQFADAAIWHHYASSVLVEGDHCSEFLSGATNIRRTTFLETGGFKENFLGAGGEEFEFAQRLLGKARVDILYVPELTTRHEFKNLLPRLERLFIRAQNFPRLTVSSRRSSTNIYLAEKIRVSAVGLNTLFLIGVIVIPDLLPLFFAGFLFYVASDYQLYLNLLKWNRAWLLPAVCIYRHLQYLAIALGGLVGILSHARTD